MESLRLAPRHLDDLRRSGLTDATVADLAFYSVTREEATGLLGFDPGCGGLAIPFPTWDGQPPFTRIKPDLPFFSSNRGKPARYLSPRGADNRLYVPALAQRVLQDVTVPLMLTEGEKKAAKACQEGVPCIAVTGVSCWRQRPRDGRGDKLHGAPGEPRADLNLIEWRNRSVFLCFDSDVSTKPEVRRELWALRCELAKRGAVVRVVYLPAGDDGAKAGLDDFLVAHGPDDFQALLGAAPVLDFDQRCREVVAVPDARERDSELRRLIADLARDGDAIDREHAKSTLCDAGIVSRSAFNAALKDSAPHDDGPRRSAADRLVDLAQVDLSLLFVDQFGAPHVLAHGQPFPLTSGCYRWLRVLLWHHEQKAARGEDLSMAAGTLAAAATASNEVRELHVRSAWREAALFVELRAGCVVRVDRDGWRILDAGEDAPLFRRFVNLKPLPDPEQSGSLDSLLDLLPLRAGRDRRLMTAYFVTGLLPHIARPILQVTGEKGSGKTTAHRIVKRLLDPTAPESIRLDRDALQKASHCAVIFLDNLTSLPDWAADTLCRWVTGEADSKRRLYSDDEDVIYEIRRLVLLNGINPPADRPDVLDRCLCLELERIPEGRRLPEAEIWRQLDEHHAEWLGATFDRLSKAMAVQGSLSLENLPRLADWGVWAAAVYRAAGWTVDAFMSDWRGNVAIQNSVALDGSVFVQVLRSFMDDRPRWQGTSSDLHVALEQHRAELGYRRDRTYPGNSVWVSRRLREFAPALAEIGLSVLIPPRRDNRSIVIEKAMENTVGTVGTVETSALSGLSGDGKGAGPGGLLSADAFTDGETASDDGKSRTFSGEDVGAF